MSKDKRAGQVGLPFKFSEMCAGLLLVFSNFRFGVAFRGFAELMKNPKRSENQKGIKNLNLFKKSQKVFPTNVEGPFSMLTR